MLQHKMAASEAEGLLGISQQALNKKLREIEGIQKSQGRLYFGHDVSRQIFHHQFTQSKIISTHIVKGGTGKTSITQSMGIKANLLGARILFVDLDHQGNLTQSLGVNCDELPILCDLIEDDLPINDLIVDIAPGIALIPSRMENVHADFMLSHKRPPLDRYLVRLFEPLKKKFDLILLDCPPALGPLMTSATIASDLIILPITPDGFSIRALACNFREYSEIEKNFEIKINRKILINRFDARTSLSHEVMRELLQHPLYAADLLGGYVRTSQEFTVCSHGGRTIYDTLKQTTAKEDIDLIAKEILGIKPLENVEELKKVVSSALTYPDRPLPAANKEIIEAVAKRQIDLSI
jgi:chromosome partitioning protein